VYVAPRVVGQPGYPSGLNIHAVEVVNAVYQPRDHYRLSVWRPSWVVERWDTFDVHLAGELIVVNVNDQQLVSALAKGHKGKLPAIGRPCSCRFNEVEGINLVVVDYARQAADYFSAYGMGYE